MRAEPTLTEQILWQILRREQLGVSFRRQVVVGRFVADFLAPKIKLIVEVDGGYHGRPARARADARRDRDLGRLGYRVVHVPADMVQHRLVEAVTRIVLAIESSP
jgi:very-short-patch-repair endonuclease